jgi:hypothetical protein
MNPVILIHLNNIILLANLFYKKIIYYGQPLHIIHYRRLFRSLVNE